MSKNTEKHVETRELTFEFECKKCNYNNKVTYNWPEKVYQQMEYEFETFCTDCGKKHIHKYIEEIKSIEDTKEE